MKFTESQIHYFNSIVDIWRPTGVSREKLIEKISCTPFRQYLPEVFWWDQSPEVERMLLEMLSVDAGEWEKYLSPEAQVRLAKNRS